MAKNSFREEVTFRFKDEDSRTKSEMESHNHIL